MVCPPGVGWAWCETRRQFDRTWSVHLASAARTRPPLPTDGFVLVFHPDRPKARLGDPKVPSPKTASRARTVSRDGPPGARRRGSGRRRTGQPALSAPRSPATPIAATSSHIRATVRIPVS